MHIQFTMPGFLAADIIGYGGKDAIMNLALLVSISLPSNVDDCLGNSNH